MMNELDSLIIDLLENVFLKFEVEIEEHEKEIWLEIEKKINKIY